VTPEWSNAGERRFPSARPAATTVPRRFALGATMLRPIAVELADGNGIDRRFVILLTGKVHRRVRAFPAAADGPAVWTNPVVNRTLFVNDGPAQALLTETLGVTPRLKPVRLVEARHCYREQP
jgi:hypothetical protein